MALLISYPADKTVRELLGRTWVSSLILPNLGCIIHLLQINQLAFTSKWLGNDSQPPTVREQPKILLSSGLI